MDEEIAFLDCTAMLVSDIGDTRTLGVFEFFLFNSSKKERLTNLRTSLFAM